MGLLCPKLTLCAPLLGLKACTTLPYDWDFFNKYVTVPYTVDSWEHPVYVLE